MNTCRHLNDIVMLSDYTYHIYSSEINVDNHNY